MLRNQFRGQTLTLIAGCALLANPAFAVNPSASMEHSMTAGGHGGGPGAGHGGFTPPSHGGNPGGHSAGHGPTPGAGPGAGFHPQPGHGGSGYPVNHPHGPGYSFGHDAHGNIQSPHYAEFIGHGRGRMEEMRRREDVRRWVDDRGGEFRRRERDVFLRDSDRFLRSREMYRGRYQRWWNEGFYGGCYWSFHPFYDIDSYFYNPFVYWFYVNDWDDGFYRAWYGSDYDAYPELRVRYRRVGMFYPTEEFRDIAVGMSALDISAQIRYRRAVERFGDRLELEFKLRGGMALADNSVVVTHYQTLPENRGIVVEGFVDQDHVHLDFKALQNIADPDQTSVFAVSPDDAEPSRDQLSQLQQVNASIVDQGGVAEGDDPSQSQTGAPSDSGWDDSGSSDLSLR